MKRKLKLPIGIDNFDKLRTEGFYYVDKTQLIADLLYDWSEVNLFTRPRRFGKSLNMDMIKSFLEIDNKKILFDGLKITQYKDLCEDYMGKFPVISISLKGVDGKTFSEARDMLADIIKMEFIRHKKILEIDEIDEYDKKQFEKVISDNISSSVLSNSLLILSKLLYKAYGKKVIILIDEYDVPLDKANIQGFYDDMILLIRKLFGQCLKTNDSLYFAVLTGCLRVSKESIFTGLNNPKVFSITNVKFDEYFGFTDQEVKDILNYYKLSKHYETIKSWYDGYRFGKTDVYCPWDVLNYCSELCDDDEAQPEAYWANTSGNDIIMKFIGLANDTTKMELERIIEGYTVSKAINQELTYKDLTFSIDNLWSVLFTTGYLTQRGTRNGDVFQLAIPNLEIRKIFKNNIYKWFSEFIKADNQKLNALYAAFQFGNVKEAQNIFEEFLRKTISIRDTNVPYDKKENFYHGILLGLLSNMDSWRVRSNIESGDGYSDIIIEIDDYNTGIIIEVKYGENENMDSGCAQALKQIEERNYSELLKNNGITNILKYGIACYKKRCKIVLAE